MIGWALILFAGQVVLRAEAPVLEWVAILWLCTGMWLVRRTACLPLLLMTCPAFMCEIQRPWAWAQVLVCASLFLRVLVDLRVDRRRLLGCIALGTVVLFLSWPDDIQGLYASLTKFSGRELLAQFVRPSAAWAVFPFRQAFDRALIAALCAGMLLAGGYFASHRVWKALRFCGVAAIIATFGAILLPWQAPHIFLGTSNYGAAKMYSFLGAGYNASNLTMLLAVGLPWLFVPWRYSFRWLFLGLAGLLLPVVAVRQSAFYLAVLVLVCASALLWGWSMFRPARRRIAAHWRWGTAEKRAAIVIGAATCAISAFWFVKMDGGSECSYLRRGLQWEIQKCLPQKTPARVYQPTQPDLPAAVPDTRVDPLPRQDAGRLLVRAPETPAGTDPVPVHAPVSGAGMKVGLLGRLEQWLSKYDATRGTMWPLALRTIKARYNWKGAGAGTWARFHRAQKRPYKEYYAHLHCTYLDLMFEYGWVPMLCLYIALTAGLCQVLQNKVAGGRLWLLYLLAVGTMAVSQHLFYAFTNLCLLLPAFILVPRALVGWICPSAGGKRDCRMTACCNGHGAPGQSGRSGVCR